jgi:hypothetical protein
MADIDRRDVTDRLEPSYDIEARCLGCNERTRRTYSTPHAEREDMKAWASLHEGC